MNALQIFMGSLWMKEEREMGGEGADEEGYWVSSDDK